MNLVRTFIAIEIPPHIQQKIQLATSPLRQQFSRETVRWIAPHAIHLTLKFLGDAPSHAIPVMTDHLRRALDWQPAFVMEIGHLGIFPSPSRPRIIWIGIQKHPELFALQKTIDQALSQLGHPIEKRPFSPHLTIGRVGQHVQNDQIKHLSQAMSENPVGSLGKIIVNQVHLVKSDLKPTGAIYTKLHSLDLVNTIEVKN